MLCDRIVHPILSFIVIILVKYEIFEIDYYISKLNHFAFHDIVNNLSTIA